MPKVVYVNPSLTPNGFTQVPGPKPVLRRPFSVQTTFQFSGFLLPTTNDENLEKVHSQAEKIVLGWLGNLYPGSMPPEAQEGKSFVIEQPGNSIEAIAIPEQGLWCARFEHPDMGLGAEIPAVAGRAWATDISLARTEEGIAVGILVRCSTPPGTASPVSYIRPRVVRELAKKLRLISNIQITENAITVQDASWLPALKGFLEDPARNLPIVMLTNPDHRGQELTSNPWVLDESIIAKRLLGKAHVILLPSDHTFAWSDLVGKAWGVYRGAVRVYRPGLQLERQSPFSHPLYTFDRIIGMEQNGRLGPEICADAIDAMVSEMAAFRPLRFDRTPFIPEARRLIATVERQKMMDRLEAASSGTKQAAELKSQLDQIRRQSEKEQADFEHQVDELKQNAQDYFDEAISHAESLARYKAEAAGMMWQIVDLQERLRTSGKNDTCVPIPTSYEEMPEWVSKHLSGRLRLHPRAERALKDAAYERVDVIYKALQLLADDYQPMKLAQPGAKDRFEKGLSELELSCGPSITKSRAGEQDDEYFVRWPLGSTNAPWKFLEFHLRKGNSKDKRICLGIYFFWDEDEQVVVVGSLPAHLDNRLT